MSGACGASPQNCTSSQNRVDRALNAILALATSALNVTENLPKITITKSKHSK